MSGKHENINKETENLKNKIKNSGTEKYNNNENFCQRDSKADLNRQKKQSANMKLGQQKLWSVLNRNKEMKKSEQ